MSAMSICNATSTFCLEPGLLQDPPRVAILCPMRAPRVGCVGAALGDGLDLLVVVLSTPTATGELRHFCQLLARPCNAL